RYQRTFDHCDVLIVGAGPAGLAAALAAGESGARVVLCDENPAPGGSLLAEAARRYCQRYGAKVGDRVVVATAHDSAYRAALELKKAGVSVELIADLR